MYTMAAPQGHSNLILSQYLVYESLARSVNPPPLSLSLSLRETRILFWAVQINK